PARVTSPRRSTTSTTRILTIMAQLFGCIDQRNATSIPALLENMGRLQQRAAQSGAQTWVDRRAGVGMGRVSGADAGCLASLDPVVDGPAGIWVLDGDIHRISSSALGIHPSDSSVRPVGDPSTSSCPRSSPTSQAAPRGTLPDTIPALY